MSCCSMCLGAGMAEMVKDRIEKKENMGLQGWSAVIGTWVSIVGAFLGGGAALTTYQDEVAKMEDARVVQTFQLFEMFNSPERLYARQRVMDAANSKTAFAPQDLWVTLDFFDALQICVHRDLCDEALSVRLFQPYAVPIWEGLGESIVSARTASDPGMGGGLEWLATLPPPEIAAGSGAPAFTSQTGALQGLHMHQRRVSGFLALADWVLVAAMALASLWVLVRTRSVAHLRFPLHWGLDGTVNWRAPRWVGLSIVPALAVVTLLLMQALVGEGAHRIAVLSASVAGVYLAAHLVYLYFALRDVRARAIGAEL